VKKMLKRSHLLVLVFTLFSFVLQAGHHEEDSHESEKEFNATEVILHHIQDSHEFHMWGEHEHSVSIPLPIILYSFDKGFVTFMSSSFEHGTKSVEGFEMTTHGIVDAHGNHEYLITDLFSHECHASFLDLSITRNVFTMFVGVVILLLIFFSVANSYKKRGSNQAPKGMQNLMESIIFFVRDEIAVPNIGEKKYKKFMPYLLTVFFFIWVVNLLGLVPFFPGGSNVTGNIAVTLVLAIFTTIATNVFASTKDYWGHIFWMPGVPLPVKLLLAPIELIGVFTKPFALTIRLFANITAGHIVVLSLISLIFILKNIWVSPASVALALFIDVLELLVAFLQAFVFTMLSALFIGSAAEEHDHEHAH